MNLAFLSLKPIAVPSFFIYFALFIFVMMICLLLMIFFKFIKLTSTDKLIFIDKANRWNMLHVNLKNLDDYSYKNSMYFLTDKGSMTNKKGKALYVFSEGKPEPMVISYNKNEWVTSESLMAIINNKLIQKLVQTSDSFKDTLLLWGSIGGIMAGIASVLILLKQFGIIK